MQIAAIICLSVGIVAAAAAIVLQANKIKKAGKPGKGSVATIVFASLYIVIAVINFIFVIPML